MTSTRSKGPFPPELAKLAARNKANRQRQYRLALIASAAAVLLIGLLQYVSLTSKLQNGQLEYMDKGFHTAYLLAFNPISDVPEILGSSVFPPHLLMPTYLSARHCRESTWTEAGVKRGWIALELIAFGGTVLLFPFLLCRYGFPKAAWLSALLLMVCIQPQTMGGSYYGAALWLILLLLAILTINRKRRSLALLTGLVAGLIPGFHPASVFIIPFMLFTVIWLTADCFRGRKAMVLMVMGGFMASVSLVPLWWLSNPSAFGHDIGNMLWQSLFVSGDRPILLTIALTLAFATSGNLALRKALTFPDIIKTHMPSLLTIMASSIIPGLLIMAILNPMWPFTLSACQSMIIVGIVVLCEDKGLRPRHRISVYTAIALLLITLILQSFV